MTPPAGRLRRLGALLARPGDDALEVLAQAAELEPWIGARLAELAEVGLEEWRG